MVLKDPSDEAFARTVERTLRAWAADGVYGIGDVLTAAEARERYGYWGEFSFVIDTSVDGGTMFGDKIEHPLVTRNETIDYRYGRGSHGHLPEKGPQPVFCAKGPAFKENYTGAKGRIYDIAPTLAAAMGIPFFACDGTVLTDLLKNGSTREAAK